MRDTCKRFKIVVKKRIKIFRKYKSCNVIDYIPYKVFWELKLSQNARMKLNIIVLERNKQKINIALHSMYVIRVNNEKNNKLPPIQTFYDIVQYHIFTFVCC